MKITKQLLREIIQEEVKNLLKEETTPEQLLDYAAKVAHSANVRLSPDLAMLMSAIAGNPGFATRPPPISIDGKPFWKWITEATGLKAQDIAAASREYDAKMKSGSK
jgi:hypothetical protein